MRARLPSPCEPPDDQGIGLWFSTAGRGNQWDDRRGGRARESNVEASEPFATKWFPMTDTKAAGSGDTAPPTKAKAKPTPKAKAKKVYLSQADVPRYPLDEALRIANAISDQYGKQPTSPLDIAVALDMKPSSGPFRYLCGTALAYGITDGGPRTPLIALTDLGRRIVAPTEDGDDLRAKRQALLQPRVVGDFLRKYNTSKLPADQIGRNVLEAMGVPADATERTFTLIVDSAKGLGLLREIKGDLYVQLDSSNAPALAIPDETTPDETTYPAGEADEAPSLEDSGATPPPTKPPSDLKTNRRVFITHGKNTKIVEQLKELLGFGDFEPVVSAQRESVSKPVPDKVLDDMRSCGAAVIHVGVEQRLLDSSGEEIRSSFGIFAV